MLGEMMEKDATRNLGSIALSVLFIRGFIQQIKCKYGNLLY